MKLPSVFGRPVVGTADVVVRIALTALVLPLIHVGAAAAAWPEPPTSATWRTQEDGPIRVECTTADGLPWCRSSAVLPAPLSSLVTIVNDFDSYPLIFTHISAVRALEPNVKYLRLDYPSPLADRDYSATFDRTEGPEGFRVWWHAVEHPAEPPHPGVIRLSLAAGQWELRPDPLGTRVVYTWEAEMSGDIAEWIQGRARTINGVEVLAGLARAANVAPLAAP